MLPGLLYYTLIYQFILDFPSLSPCAPPVVLCLMGHPCCEASFWVYVRLCAIIVSVPESFDRAVMLMAPSRLIHACCLRATHS